MGNIDFKVISATEYSNTFQKTRFWKEKSVENVVTRQGLAFNWSMISFHIWPFKKSIHTLQNNVHMLSFPILWWVRTWANSTSHTSSPEIFNLWSLSMRCQKSWKPKGYYKRWPLSCFSFYFLIAHYYNMALSFGGEWDIESANVGWILTCKYQNLTQDYIENTFHPKKPFFFKALIHSLSTTKKSFNTFIAIHCILKYM